jgi:hypothetical protein
MRPFHDRAQPKVCQRTTFCRFLRTNGWLASRTTPVLALRLDPLNVNGTNQSCRHHERRQKYLTFSGTAFLPRCYDFLHSSESTPDRFSFPCFLPPANEFGPAYLTPRDNSVIGSDAGSLPVPNAQST